MYDRRVLAGYDLGVLGLSCRLIWRCPKSFMQAAYNRAVGKRHLELGVGTGYFLDRGSFETPPREITLVDLNPVVLQVAGARLARYQPSCVRANVCDPLPVGPGIFDSAALNFLLHCLPGDWSVKGSVLSGAARALRAGGQVFGSTILAEGLPVSGPARRLMVEYNRRGVFHNSRDDLAGLRRALESTFDDVRLTSRGCVALFEATARGWVEK
ncbi:MAG: class I SAM-dependent methyltransferase [Micromonosporaceae bacterium]|nr:class I SAM-dependent methyltransferase [Micromonosporaceae bacterium]